ncbi:hypothetical protein ACQP2E_19690 [Actinoplanes sp. CA-015351]|uniref:hypothetical protein n=1 Tax=Actinoplanes sp. CA-015351 TaxID=3239897 RepID=UPI003D995A13
MPIEFSEEGWEQLTPEQRASLRFIEQMTGTRTSDGPPPPGSPLARALALTEALRAGQITEEEHRAALGRIMDESLTERLDDPA